MENFKCPHCEAPLGNGVTVCGECGKELDSRQEQTSAPEEHFQASVFRAVENRVNVLRSANTGISGFISPEGKIISLVADASGKEIFVEGYKMQSIPATKGAQSFYTSYGDWFILMCFIFVLGSIIIR